MMQESKYWTVTVQLVFTNEKGKAQKVKEHYLVDAVSATEAEAKIYKEFEGESNFDVISAVKSRIIKVLEN
jgi:hypothetical protein